MAEFVVTAAQLNNKSQELESMNKQLESYISNLESQEQALNGMWDGPANEAFHQAFVSDMEQMKAFIQLILQYCQTLGTIASKYSEVEAQNVEIAQTRKYR
ncbi:MAG: WXG100 family type VII secretion target [Lachnospiraceae bacterium]|nr:WXG100 family type VII secretion target [Lachnospiraceae bacterium]